MRCEIKYLASLSEALTLRFSKLIGGKTFGSISALFGLSHGIIDQTQYSFLVATVIGSAVIPTLIANAFFLPHHLLRKPAATAIQPVSQQALANPSSIIQP